MSRSLLALALALAAAMGAQAAAAAESTKLTIYRSDSASLYSAASRGSVATGYAVVHESRTLDLDAGRQVVHIDGLPEQLDTEALELRFPGRDDIQMLASRVLLPNQSHILSSQLGESVTVRGDDGQLLASGPLLATTRRGLLVDDRQAGPVLVSRYASVSLGSVDIHRGVRLRETLHADHAGTVTAKLVYPTAGMGWRASYSAVLHEDDGHCRLQWQSRASIANRSGRDWHAATLKLVAGEPNFAKSSGPHPVMMRSMVAAAPGAESLPQQRPMGAYRSYTIDGAIDLPTGSITQMPLYPQQALTCQHRYVLEHGSPWQPPQPQTSRNFGLGGDDQIASRLQFEAFDNLPAGYLRVTGVFSGQREFLGEARIPDTPENQPVKVTLGTAFALRGQRERTAFALDDQANTLTESFRITLSNSGEQARKVTVREHPRRWHEWSLLSSSLAATHKSIDTLEFVADVPAHGQIELDYTLRYHWRTSDE